MALRSRTRRPSFVVAAVVAASACLTAVVAPTATAATVGVDAAGALHVTGTPAADVVTLARIDDATLQLTDASGAIELDASATSCVRELDGPVRCAVTTSTAVAVRLGDADDRLDATAAGALALDVDGGFGNDQLFVGSAGRTRIMDPTTADIVDLAHAEEAITVRWSAADARLVARCAGCPTPWQVVLPTHPGRVVLGGYADSVDLRTWRGPGRTTWLLGDDRDLWLGSPVPTRRNMVDAGDGWDTLISYAAADVLRGGPGFDKLVDFGGAGDVLLGGPETDSLSSLDGRRDTLDGHGGRDMCLTIRITKRGCDSGPVRGMETTLYHPLTQPARILRSLGILL